MNIWLLLPAFNEEASLYRLIPKIHEEFERRNLAYRVVVIEDGSTDQTEAVLKKLASQYPIDVLKHRLNRGLGETERDGFEYIADRSLDEDVVIRFDCDDTHEPKYVFDLIRKLEEGYDVVNTSRFQPGGRQIGVGHYRAFISFAANLFMKLIFHIPNVKDYSCGYRAYRTRVIKDAVRIFGNGFIQLKGLGFTSTLETIVKLHLLGCRFAEVPFVLRYDNKASYSKMVSSITTLGYLTMAIIYHWPFGGWKSFYSNLAELYRRSPQQAVEKYGIRNMIRSAVCQIGG